ncbi:MAG TPA: MarP family serine protease [Actinomycetota bacterium]|nr:MarP family serine protease [Actinomycetota bacterium]
MNWVDLVILGALGLGIWTGYRRGAVMQIFSWGGFVLGLVLGFLLAPPLVGTFVKDPESASIPIYTIVALLGIAFIVEGIVAAFAMRLRKRITNATVNKTDKIIGSAIAALLSLVGSWLLGSTLRSVPAKSVASAVRGSAIIRVLNDIAPPPLSITAEISRLLRNSGFPEVFAALNPSLAPGVEPPPAALADDREVLAAAEITYKIESRGCNGLVDGSGFPIGSDLLVTAAHVVAGTSDHKVIPATGRRTFQATVVYMDTDKDIAIMRVKLPGKVFFVESDHASRNTDGAAIGYPGGGKRKISPARVRSRTQARGYDIYSQGTVTRTIYVLHAEVRQGNSGGPFVDEDGKVRGMVFAASREDPNESYALAETEIFRAVDRAKGKTKQVDTGRCAL